MADWRNLPTVYLKAGELFVDRRPHLVATVLGSCVAVCLWDAHLGYGGMTHSLLPAPRPGECPSPRHTEVAVARLVQGMLHQGSRRGDLRAKLFGGANLLMPRTSSITVGSANVHAALTALKRHGIPLTAREVDGHSGLVIKMDSGQGEVWVRRI